MGIQTLGRGKRASTVWLSCQWGKARDTMLRRRAAALLRLAPDHLAGSKADVVTAEAAPEAPGDRPAEGQHGRQGSSTYGSGRDSSSSSTNINTGGSAVICHKMANASPTGDTPLQNGKREPQVTCRQLLSHKGLRLLLRRERSALLSSHGEPQRVKVPDQPTSSLDSPPHGAEHPAETTVPHPPSPASGRALPKC